jgi:hypothetical protein
MRKLRSLTIIYSVLPIGKNEKAEKVDPSSFLYLGKNEKAENVDYYLFSS